MSPGAKALVMTWPGLLPALVTLLSQSSACVVSRTPFSYRTLVTFHPTTPRLSPVCRQGSIRLGSSFTRRLEFGPGQSSLDFSSSASWSGGAGIAGLQGLFFYDSTHFRSFPPLLCHSGNSGLAAGSKQAGPEDRLVLFATRYTHRTYVI